VPAVLLLLCALAFGARLESPAMVRFVFWAPGEVRQDWARMRGELRGADLAVLLAPPSAIETLNAVSAGAMEAAEARRALGATSAQDRFGDALIGGLYGRGVPVASPPIDGAELADALRGIEAAREAGDERRALRELAAVHARQGESLEAFVREAAFERPGRRIVVLQRLPYTLESVRLAQAGARVERVFLPGKPVRFSQRDAEERRLLRLGR
jgi:hypothetical protein